MHEDVALLGFLPPAQREAFATTLYEARMSEIENSKLRLQLARKELKLRERVLDNNHAVPQQERDSASLNDNDESAGDEIDNCSNKIGNEIDDTNEIENEIDDNEIDETTNTETQVMNDDEETKVTNEAKV